jgi:hypothetical protein
MVIFQPLVAEGFEWINTCDHQDYEVFAAFDGQPRAQSWRPIKVRRVRADDRSAFNPSDFPWLGGHALVMRQKAVDRLRDILDAHGEVLPLATDDDVDLFVFNARVVDALDEARSLITKIPGTNRILHIEKVVFIEPAVRGLDIFRLPHRVGETYVSERFVDRAKAAGLVGLKFEKVWSAT